jgi:hypothetical protein
MGGPLWVKFYNSRERKETNDSRREEKGGEGRKLREEF